MYQLKDLKNKVFQILTRQKEQQDMLAERVSTHMFQHDLCITDLYESDLAQMII